MAEKGKEISEYVDDITLVESDNDDVIDSMNLMDNDILGGDVAKVPEGGNQSLEFTQNLHTSSWMHPSSTNMMLNPQGWGIQPANDGVGSGRITSNLHEVRDSNAPADVGASLTLGSLPNSNAHVWFS